MPFVLDNSVVSAWLIHSQATPYSARIAALLQTDVAIAPALLKLEYANVLRTACRRQRMLAAQAHEALTLLGRLPLTIVSDEPDAALILDLALRHDLSSYDAVYLDLALRRRLPLATQDVDLAAAARASGVGVVEG